LYSDPISEEWEKWDSSSMAYTYGVQVNPSQENRLDVVFGKQELDPLHQISESRIVTVFVFDPLQIKSFNYVANKGEISLLEQESDVINSVHCNFYVFEVICDRSLFYSTWESYMEFVFDNPSNGAASILIVRSQDPLSDTVKKLLQDLFTSIVLSPLTGGYSWYSFVQDINMFLLHESVISLTDLTKNIIFLDTQTGVPSPRIVSTTPSASEVTLGEKVTITVEATNDGGMADWQSIAISFPDISDASRIEIVDSSDFDLGGCCYVVGDEVGYGYGSGNRPLEEYPMVEASSSYWDREITKSFSVSVQPENAGAFTFYVKSVASVNEDYSYHDPVTNGGNVQDQQNEWAYEKTINVIQEILCKDITTDRLEYGPNDAVLFQFNVVNSGESSVVLDSYLKLRHPLKETLGTASLKKIELAAGEEKLIEVEYGPPSGWGYEWPKGEVEWGLVLCEIEKQLTYKDEWIDVFSVRDLDEILCLPPYEIVWNSASYNEDGAIKNVECTVEADPNGNAYAKTFVDTAAWGGGYSLALFTYGDRWVAPASGEYEIHWRVKLSGNSKLVCYAPFYGHAATRNEVWIILSVKDVDSGVSILEPRKIPILSIADPESIERDILGSLAVDLTEASLETFAEIPYLGEAVKAIQLTSALSKIAYPMNDEIRGPQDICERIILAGGREYQWSISIYTSSVSACLGMAGAWSLSNVNAEVSNVGIRPVSGDITPPETTLIEMPTGEISSRDVVFKWIGEDAVTKSSEITYEYMLVGYDSEWIQTSETSATYHNLPDESYIFKVKAKDAAGNEDVTPATTYFNIDTRGTIFVVTNCDEATWTISGPIGYSGGGKFHYQEDTPPGDYTISYNPVIGHLTPFSETKALLSGEEIVFEGDYIKADHELNIQVTGAGTTNPPPNIYTHDEGASVSVEAIADSGWSLDHWELDSVSIGSSVHITVTMDADHSLVAVFTETPIVQRHLSISISGSGSTTVGAGQHTYADGTVVSIGASPISGWMFDHWVLDGVDAGSDNPLSLTMGSDHTLTAVFTETPSWWNQQWIYRQELLITEQSGQSLTQYPIVLTLDTASLIQAGKLRPDCSDLRIIDQESQQEIPYAIRDIDSENTQIVFKIPELGPHESNTDLYLYYGNQDAQYAPENWNDIYFSFYDDFDEPIDWTRWTSETYVDTRTNRGYSISQTDSELTVSSDHTKYFGFYELYTIPIPVGDNIEVAFTLRQNTQNSEYVHTYAFLTDENSLFSGADIPETANGQRNYYEFFYQGQIAGIAFEDSPSPGAFLSVNDESITSELPNTANLLITSDRENTHQYRIHVTPSEAKCYLDDEYQLTCTENIPQYSATARILLVFGHHGAPLSSQVVDIDTIWVRSYVEPEPTIELGQETENTEQQLTADPGGPYASTEGEQVQLDASGSNSPDGEIVKYEWDLENDGEYDIQTQSSTATHAWKDDFDGTIKLRVTDSNLKQAEATTTVQIRNTAPTVEAGQDKTVETDESVSFTGSFTDPGDDTHTIIWAFGDGDTSSTLTTSHVYDSPGQYTATLTVTDDNGGEAIDILNVKVLTLTTLKLDLLPSCTFGSPLEIDGELCTPSQLIQDAQILIEYSVTGGNTWNDITMIPTDHEGKCHATWLPQATGSYIIRAKYGGEPSRYLRETSRQTSLAVTPGEANSVFSVVSNSIITNLAFDSARETLSFTISGDAGTNSHTQIVIAKTLIPDITDLKIHVDGDEVDYTYTSDESRWTLTFEYPHSSHSVVLSIQPTINQPPVAQTQQNIEGTQNSPLTFSASGSYDPDGSIAEYTWDFGDGKTGNGVTPTHTYTAEGEYMATLTITDDQGATGTTTCNVIINAPTSPPPSGGSGFIGGGGGLVLPPPDETPTVEDIQNLPPDEAADKLEEMDPEDALRIILQLDPDKKIEILNKVETDTIIEILAIMNNTEASEMLTGLQPEKSSEALSQVGFERAGEILNEMDVTDSAHVILELDMESGPKIIAEMAHDDLTEAARRVEEAVKEKIKDAPRETQREVLKKLAETLEHVDVDSLVDLFVEIAQLPETPETVATIFEAIDITKLNTIVDAWIVKEYYDELSTVMSYLTNDTLQAIYCNLSMATRGTLHPYLDEATIKALPREQLPLPDPEIIDVSINKENYHEYTIETTIQNNGNKESGELKLDYTINGKLVKRVTFASLEQQEQDTNATTWMPGKEGEYSILISLTSASDELYSDNNQYHTTRQVRFPDLQIEIILVPEEVVKNEECCIEVKVSNTSPEDIAEAFKVALLVQNQVITDEVAGLKANEEKTSSLRYTPTQIGQTSVRAEIDYNDSILESDETNNVNQTTLEVKRYSKQTVYLAGMIAASIIVLLIVGILIRRK
jgi:PKD repeat protein